MKLEKIRRLFYDFFKSKGHKIVDSAPIVIKNDNFHLKFLLYFLNCALKLVLCFLQLYHSPNYH